MAILPDDFRGALAQFATGVTVVTTRNAAGQPLGLTVSAFCSVSLDPPLVLVCVEHGADANPGLRDTGLFGVSVLAEHQEDLSRAFACKGPEKFQDLTLVDGPHGVPLVPEALARLECRVTAAHPAGDHTIYVGEVVSMIVEPGRPLLYHHSEYHRIAGEGRGPR
jgi:flavin reductase ActVB